MSEVGKILIEDLEFRNQLSTLELKIQLKNGPLRPKTILEQFINKYKKTEKVDNTTFSNSKIEKSNPLKCQHLEKNWQKILSFDVIYRSL